MVALIKQSGSDYVIGVKGNRQFLLRDIKDIMSKTQNIDSAYTQIEVNRGRTELRTVKVSSGVEPVRGFWAVCFR
jgi:hypothetical protein